MTIARPGYCSNLHARGDLLVFAEDYGWGEGAPYRLTIRQVDLSDSCTQSGVMMDLGSELVRNYSARVARQMMNVLVPPSSNFKCSLFSLNIGVDTLWYERIQNSRAQAFG